MKIFINEILLHLVERKKWHEMTPVKVSSHFKDIGQLEASKPKGNVLLDFSELAELEKLIKMIEQRKLKKLDTLIFLVDNIDEAKKFAKSLFKIIKAAGGLVLKRDRILMIYRLSCWDLPKGKLEKNEREPEGAVREVEEECNIQVLLESKICHTWHSYPQDDKWVLKKTSWYLMNCLDDRDMKPQKEEGIEDIRWMNMNEVEIALQNSYRSIKEVFNQFGQIQQA